MGGNKTVEWDLKNGTITLHNGTSDQRILVKRYDFIFSFIDEMNKVLGKQVFMMVFKKVLERYDPPPRVMENLSVETAGAYVDSLIVPVDIEKSVIPDDITWDGKTRNVEFFGAAQWRILPVSFVHHFRAAIYDVLTENGTKAIVREATKRAGIGMADEAIGNYRWKTVEELIENQDEKIYLGTFAHAGWSYSRVFSQKGADGNPLFLAKITNTYESEGVTGETRPFCQWLMSYMDGFYNGVIGKLSGKFVETREVRCRAMGDPYCAFAHKIKNEKKEILDWDDLEADWKALDAIAMPLAA
jgi:predicted hydrocarbon binding protein